MSAKQTSFFFNFDHVHPASQPVLPVITATAIMADSTQLFLVIAIIGAGALYLMRAKPVPKRASGVVKKDGDEEGKVQEGKATPAKAAAAASAAPGLLPMSIYFGSQTGTTEAVYLTY